ncbi:GAF domain-containing protein [Parasulfuritortus cantonensis]|uniref:GAF domain-containing protein n=1 Tax=Parasulfuritortus cantonensis TaxID=2528202 RepID=A0A4R1BD73_9PROT|nr:GAF domain-containing protein [Parasulfuritortus cantonensis]TCJ14974.1 GAF domain-containing protein [Parasulfuritortus cantonensis]
MSLPLRALRRCFEGAIPATIATCAPDGMPNVAKLSHVHFVDDGHVALSYQFFNKTRANILANPHALVEVVDPVSAAHYQLRLAYLRTETEGPLFETMKARLAAIASHTGMSKVFRLLGSDVYRVLDVGLVPGDHDQPGPPRTDLVAALRACQADLAPCSDLAGLLDAALASLERHLDIRHAMLLLLDPGRRCLYTVASRGYPESGVGSEVGLGEGIVGVAAAARTPIRIGHAVEEYRYSQATRRRFADSDARIVLETEIPLPGLAEAASQLALPLAVAGRLIGVLYVESPSEQRFGYEDEDAMAVLAGQLALQLDWLARGAEPAQDSAPMPAPRPAAPVPPGATVTIRHFAADHSVFVDNDYLIKGVAGAIVWKLLREYRDAGRDEFSNRELRLDGSLGLPGVTDNLDARLILLQRRLAERCPFLTMTKTGRGRFRLAVGRPFLLVEDPAP